MKTLLLCLSAMILASAEAASGAEAVGLPPSSLKEDAAKLDAANWAAGVTHVAIVIDTSGSMRDARTNRLFAPVIQTVGDTLAVYANAKFIAVLDADGRTVIPGWTPNTPANRNLILSALSRYTADNISNPIPGLRNALRMLTTEPGSRASIIVIGDELAVDDLATIPGLISQMNPIDSDGKRRARISAIQVPTVPGADTMLKFESVMKRVTAESGGTFVQLDTSAMTPATVPGWDGTTVFRGPITSAPIQQPAAPDPATQKIVRPAPVSP